MITIALYEVKEKENGMRFYNKLKEIDIPEFVETIYLDEDNENVKYVFDQNFSKQVGFYGYVKHGNVSKLTPLDRSVLASLDSKQNTGVSSESTEKTE